MRGIKRWPSKKKIFPAYFEKITRGKFLWLQTSSGKVVHNSILNIFAFYIFDLSSTVQLQSRVFCRCRFRKFRKRAKNAFFCSFFTKEIDEVSHRAICSQCYYCLFNSTHLAKTNFEFRWCVQSQQIFMWTTRPGFFVGFDFRTQIWIPNWSEANTHTTKQKAQGTHKQQQSNTECIHMYLFLCEMQHFDASWN